MTIRLVRGIYDSAVRDQDRKQVGWPSPSPSFPSPLSLIFILILSSFLKMAGLINTRLSLRWVPDEPEELTDTLVFNVGDYFMDLRVLKSDGSVDWGMAGVREILSESPLKCRWNKAIDSLGAAGEADEGVFNRLEDGNDIETGSMPCPHKNDAVTDYEEVWKILPPRSGSDRAWILQSADGKTFLGRVGGSFMAMVQGEKVFSARRQDLHAGGWNPVYAIGEKEVLPAIEKIDTKDEAGWQVGASLQVQGKEYVVRASQAI
ncbi:hypothetical protein PVAG01_04891 [Phlyctema vagabunda]|uniref:Protein HRI1 n=1 Tax=Phlyctema vagabunda TaxID=108571 RepID=A0ABR4PIK2_9HELO